MLAFVAPWCGPCRRLEPLLEEVASGRDDGVALVILRVDEHPDEVERRGVRATPTTIAVRGATEVTRIVGGLSRDQVEWLFAAAHAPEARRARAGPAGPTDLVLRLGAAAALTLAGALLAQPVLVGGGLVVAVVTAVRSRPRRGRTPTRGRAARGGVRTDP